MFLEIPLFVGLFDDDLTVAGHEGACRQCWRVEASQEISGAAAEVSFLQNYNFRSFLRVSEF